MERIQNNIIWKVLVSAEKFTVIFTLIATTAIVSLSCLYRYFLESDLVAYTEYLLPTAFWLYMIGGAYGSYEKSHITADILSAYLEEGILSSAIDVIRNLIALILGIIFTVWAFEFASWAVQIGTKSPVWRIPGVIGQSSILVGFSLMSIYNLYYFAESIEKAYHMIKKKVEVTSQC